MSEILFFKWHLGICLISYVFKRETKALLRNVSSIDGRVYIASRQLFLSLNTKFKAYLHLLAKVTIKQHISATLI